MSAVKTRRLVNKTAASSVATLPPASSYRPSKNGFTKQQKGIVIGPADTLVIINLVNSPGRYTYTIKHRQWPKQFNNQMGPVKSRTMFKVSARTYLFYL